MIHNEIFYLFSIISVGYILGNIKIRGFSLDFTAMLLVALIAGHFGMVISEDFQLFGLAIFIYAVGLQSGPGFFDTIKHEGIRLNIIAIVLLVSIFGSIFAIGKFFDLPTPLIDGIFAGALTSVPALAAALEMGNNPSISVIFGVVYPFCIMATILFIRSLPFLFRADIALEVEAYEAEQRSRYPEIFTRNVRISNENFEKNTISKHDLESMTSTVIERMSSLGQTDEERGVLHVNDVIRATGTHEQLNHLSLLCGPEVSEEHHFQDNMKVFRLLTTNKEIVGKKIGSIKALKSFRAMITRVRRAGIDIAAHPNLTLRLGDKLYVVAPEIYTEKVTKLIGNDLLKYPAADFLPISLGVVLGILIGSIPIMLPFVGVIKLSFVGGILISALILGRIGRVGPIVWNLAPHSTTLLKTLGQLIFIAGIGTNAGKYLVESLHQHGFTPVLIGLAGLLFGLSVVAFTCRVVFKMNVVNIMGLLSGAMTSTPSLTMANNVTKTDYPSIAYAAVYPMGLVVVIVLAQLGLKLF